MSQLSYTPSMEERGLKAAFLVSIKHLPPEGSYTLARINQLCPHISLDGLWSKPGFKEWFTNIQEFEEMAELAAIMAMITSMEVMSNPNEKGQAKVTAAKLAVETADKMPKGRPISGLPKAIDEMDEAQLKAFIQQNTDKLKLIKGESK